MNIPLGYEIGSGRRVAIPVNHTVVLGQTQLSGKTTTLEAMVTRSGLRAVGFITKPGEKSFRQQTQIPAFFSESTITDYWKYVVSIVENLMSVKLGWQERGWIVKLCQDYADKTKAKAYRWKRPKTLKELLGNVRIALPHLRGNAEMICMQLQEYLDSVVREIGHTEFSDRLDLEPGINVMDVTELSDGLKALVIRSVIEWVHKHGRRIVVIIPEAWKFIPEGRSTPVKLALEGLIREGAGVGNFVWMDSQDLRGVDKLLLRSVIVWLFGVQRQKNEVASTLASIPDHPKPTATEIMQLGKGEFYVCYGTTLVRTYVQPAGMEDAHAQAIARGDESPDSWRQISKALDEEGGAEAARQETKTQEISGDLEQVPNEAGDRDDLRILSEGCPAGVENKESSESEGEEFMLKMKAPNPTPITERFRDYLKLHAVPNDLRDNLVPFLAEYDTLAEAHDALARRLVVVQDLVDKFERDSSAVAPTAGAMADESAEALAEAERSSSSAPIRFDLNTIRKTADGKAEAPKEVMEMIWSYVRLRAGNDPGILDQVYRAIKQQAANDPGILELLTRRPELRVTVERQTIEADGGTLRGALALLISRKFFDSPQNGNSAFNELKRLGRPVAKPNVYRELDKLAELGFVTKEPAGYQVVLGMKVHIVESGKAATAR